MEETTDLDILVIDQTIRNTFDQEFSRLYIYEEKLKEIINSLSDETLKTTVKKSLEKARDDLEQYISELNVQSQYHFYLMESISYIEEYKDILKTPIKANFMGKKNKRNKEKSNVVSKYLEIAHKYVDTDGKIPTHESLSQNTTRIKKPSQTKCLNCPNKKEFDNIDGNIFTCTKCYAQQIVIKHTSSYNDIDRVNITNKYMYDRKVHFRDCINQYQGKQNSTVAKKIYTDLSDQFRLHHLLDEDAVGKAQFRNITKKHILLFLKELGYSKHYENVHLIHYNLTGIKPDDISHLESQLLDDFDVLTDLYDKRFKNINRRNFINTQYVLYQLLCRHKHPCKNEEFIILKTIDRKFFHDDICKTLFEELGLTVAQALRKIMLVLYDLI